MINPTIDPAILMLIIGGVSAIVLAIASKVFFVKTDPRISEVEDALPGANCGGCGYTGCGAAAEAIVKGAPVNICVAGGQETWVKVAAAMGAEVGFVEAKMADNFCTRSNRASKKYEYDGALDCRSAFALGGGEIVCETGCLGLGTCVRACPFDALYIGHDGVPEVDLARCVGCGTCERVCPTGAIGVHSMSDKLLHFNSSDECLAPCKQLCPAQIDIRTYIDLAKQGKYAEAISVIRERNPLPVTCGRVCPAPCEAGCRRNHVDENEPVHHNYIKRFVADWEMQNGGMPKPLMLPDSGKTVAIIGGGPSGISAAYYLARLGHKVTIFEAKPALGGMIRYGIPEYRLPKARLDFEIQQILDLGVEARCNTHIGRDVTLEQLDEQFDALYLAAGAWDNSTMRVEGEDLPGVYKGTEFLQKRELGEVMDLTGKVVVVVGGGNTAIDAARTSLRLGAKSVNLLYRRTRNEMPANLVEIVASEHEGINFMFLAAPTRIIPENGKAAKLEYLKMQLGEPDASGRRRPEPIEGSETLMDIDVIISAIGQKPRIDFISEEFRAKNNVGLTRWNTIEADDETLQTNYEKLFVGGDLFSGPALVVDAIGTGRRAARSVHLYLSGEPLELPKLAMYKPIRLKQSDDIAVNGVRKTRQVPQPELEVDERIHTFEEVDLTLDKDLMIKEASRCLGCGTICFYTDAQREEKQKWEDMTVLEKLQETLRESP